MARPRVGFLGVGWIGRQRMAAMMEEGAIEPAVIVDPSPAMVAAAVVLAPAAKVATSLDEMLALNLDGVVIATPSALHADQAIRVLDAGTAVFCQKPLGRSLTEVAAVVAAARRADRLLAVDLSYRFTTGMERIAALVRSGALGHIFAVDLVFHNAYGPDKAWFYDRRLSGGGCLVDLGVHLVDLALWALGFPALDGPVDAALTSEGRPFDGSTVEDHAFAGFTLAGGTRVRLACSWRLHAGCDAEIAASFYGTAGGVALRNVAGSFYDFRAEHLVGTGRTVVSEPPDAWGGRAACEWARRLATRPRFDPAAREYEAVAEVIDRIYASALL